MGLLVEEMVDGMVQGARFAMPAVGAGEHPAGRIMAGYRQDLAEGMEELFDVLAHKMPLRGASPADLADIALRCGNVQRCIAEFLRSRRAADGMPGM